MKVHNFIRDGSEYQVKLVVDSGRKMDELPQEITFYGLGKVIVDCVVRSCCSNRPIDVRKIEITTNEDLIELGFRRELHRFF